MTTAACLRGSSTTAFGSRIAPAVARRRRPPPRPHRMAVVAAALAAREPAGNTDPSARSAFGTSSPSRPCMAMARRTRPSSMRSPSNRCASSGTGCGIANATLSSPRTSSLHTTNSSTDFVPRTLTERHSSFPPDIDHYHHHHRSPRNVHTCGRVRACDIRVYVCFLARHLDLWLVFVCVCVSFAHQLDTITSYLSSEECAFTLSRQSANPPTNQPTNRLTNHQAV